MHTTSQQLIAAAQRLAREAGRLSFSEPVTLVYNPLDYAWNAHEVYLRRFGTGQKRVVFLGMNPGPFGMVQTGIPFGEICAVRDWMRLEAPIRQPKWQHPKRPIEGFSCRRSEVSGQRLWGLFAQRFGTAEKFFAEHFVVNFCPLAFLEASGRNRTPDKIQADEVAPLFAACDEHLAKVVSILEPEWVIGIGGFAAERAALNVNAGKIGVGQILHPSPANPAANRDWAGLVTAQLRKLGVWEY
ncbi:MAG: uracil-DNA glycosylase family protein [Verrucomicrobiota bacterium]